MGSDRFGFLLAAAIGAYALLGCTEQGADHGPVGSTATYLGAVEGTEARIALVQSGDELLAYVCGQGDTLESHTRWYAGSFALNDAGAHELAAGGWHLSFSDLSAGIVDGELIAPTGEVQRWTAQRAQDGSEVGLYESRELGCRTGVIVWGALAGPECNAQGVWCDASGARGQVTPAECTAEGPLLMRGMRDGAWFDFVAERVQLP